MELNINLKVTKHLHFGRTDLEPEDFKECDTISELERKIRQKLIPSDLDEDSVLSEKLEIPQDFIEKWKTLVGFIPDNVMTYRCMRERIAMTETTRTISGEQLNNYRYEHNWNPFSLALYRNFQFEKNARYKCYLKEVDHYDYCDTVLLYAEKVD